MIQKSEHEYFEPVSEPIDIHTEYAYFVLNDQDLGFSKSDKFVFPSVTFS